MLEQLMEQPAGGTKQCACCCSQQLERPGCQGHVL